MPSEPALQFVLRPPGRPAYSVNLDQLTAMLKAARAARNMNFLDKMKRAGNVAADLEAAAERDADALIARGADLDGKRHRAFAVHHARLDASHDALDRFEHALDVLGNGAPPDGSGDGEPSSLAGSKTEPSIIAPDGNAYHGTTPNT